MGLVLPPDLPRAGLAKRIIVLSSNNRLRRFALPNVDLQSSCPQVKPRPNVTLQLQIAETEIQAEVRAMGTK
eukprot:gene12000-biopygen7904